MFIQLIRSQTNTSISLLVNHNDYNTLWNTSDRLIKKTKLDRSVLLVVLIHVYRMWRPRVYKHETFCKFSFACCVLVGNSALFTNLSC